MTNEREKQIEATNELLLEMIKNQKRNMKNQFMIFVIVIVCYTILMLTTVTCFFVYENQFDVQDKLIETTTESEEVIQEVSGSDSEINNVEGDMYKDNAVHEEK